ncbi:N/A [soil metagenome]
MWRFWLEGFATAAAILFLPLIGLAWLLWLRHRRAMEELWRGVSALAEGRPGWPVRARIGGVSGRLAERFNEAVPRLGARIARLEEDRQKLQAVLGGMTEGVLAVDARQRLLFANPTAQELFDLGSDSAGRLVPELIRSPQMQQAIEATLSGAGSYRSEVTMPGRDLLNASQARVVSIQGTPLPGSPTPGAVLVLHDVSELRRLERMRQDFVANASHELKTPLASIKVNAETLLDWALHDDAVNSLLLRQIDDQVNRLNALIHDMLSLARLESGQEPYQHHPMALAPVLRACAEEHRVRALARDLDLSTDLSRLEDSVEVRAADDAIRHILDNLIDNAIKYTLPGGEVRVVGKADDARVRIAVADTGMGIPREDLPRVFERFYRVDKARSRELGGTGLGLAIVKHLVQSLDGQVTVESRVGVGSTFIVILPRYLPDPEANPDEDPAPESADSPVEG